MARATSGRLVAGLPALLTLGVAALHLPFPLHGDQAFTLVGARLLDHGGTLYVDFWDIRQPGEIWFVWLAGRLFGLSEFGMHLFEVIWMMTAAYTAQAVAREVVTRRWLAALAPLTTIGLYYAHATRWELTQPEALVALPLSLCLLVALRDRHASTQAATIRRWLLFGLAAGIVAVFKLLLLAVPLSILAVSIVFRLREGEPGRLVLNRLLPSLGGMASVALLVIAHFWSRNALDELYWATVVAPAQSIAEIPRAPYRRLVHSASWFVSIFLPALPLIWLGTRRRRASLEIWLIGAWSSTALAVILLQRFHYWPYHFQLFLLPAGLLVLRGTDAALDRWAPDPAAERAIAGLLVAPLLLSATVPVGRKMMALYDAVDSGLPVGQAYRERMSPDYAAFREAAAAISGPQSQPGPIFVFGNPQVLFYSGRQQAIPLRGWATYQLLDRQWALFAPQLERARPAYIFIGDGNWSAIERRSPATVSLLRSRYKVVWKSGAGEWHELIGSQPERTGPSLVSPLPVPAGSFPGRLQLEADGGK